MEFQAIIIKEETEDSIQTEAEEAENNNNDINIFIKVQPSNTFEKDWCIQITRSDNEKGGKGGAYHSGDTKELDFQKCSYCDSIFVNSYNLYQHNLTHLKIPIVSQTVYQCENCSASYTSKSSLTKHIKAKHCTKEIIIDYSYLQQCKICKKEFSYRNWHQHMRSVHSMFKFNCTICDKSFKCLRYLIRHRKYTHDGGKRYSTYETQGSKLSCEQCPKTFRYKDLLNKHVQNCHGKTVQCEVCKSKLRSEKYLQAHMRRVHYDDGKRHKCSICRKEFKSPRYVRVHMKNSHSKQCGSCDKVCLTAKIYRDHIKKCSLLHVKDEIIE